MCRYKVAIVGCGRIASLFDDDSKRKYIATHIGAYKHVKETEVEAVCDIDKKRLQKCLNRWRIQRGYIDYREMLNEEKVDILSICTPQESHYPVVKEAASNKNIRAIFCEKPLANNVRDAQKMVKLCKEKKIILQVDHQRRFDPLHINLRKFIRSKEFGEVQQVNFYYTAGIRNTGTHMFDLLRFFFGDVVWIEACYSKNKSGKEFDPNLDGLMRFKNGLLAAFQACNVTNYLIFEMNCLLEKGRVVLKNSGFGMDFYRARASRFFSGHKELFLAKPLFNITYKRNFMVNAVTHLIKCIRKSKVSISSGEDGLAAMKLIEFAINSAKNNCRRIFLDQEKNE